MLQNSNNQILTKLCLLVTGHYTFICIFYWIFHIGYSVSTSPGYFCITDDRNLLIMLLSFTSQYLCTCMIQWRCTTNNDLVIKHNQRPCISRQTEWSPWKQFHRHFWNQKFSTPLSFKNGKIIKANALY